MPIEVQIEKRHGKSIPVEETQRLARIYAGEQIVRQKADFERLGVLGDWDHPYTTMAFKSEAHEIRTLGRILEKGFIYRGLKPVNWCFDCRSALAEAEVEHETAPISPSTSRFRSTMRIASARGRVRAHALPRGRDGRDLDDDAMDDSSNQALNANPQTVYALVATSRGHLVLAQSSLKRASRASSSRDASSPPRRRGARADRPPSVYDRPSPVYLGDYVDARAGHRDRPFVAAYGVEDFLSLPPLRMKDDEILNPVGADGRFASSLPFWRRKDMGGESADRRQAASASGAAVRRKFTHSYCTAGGARTPIIYRATTQWFAGMDDVPGWNGAKPATTLRETALAGIKPRSSFRRGAGPLYGMIANRLDWTLRASGRGRADAVLHPQGDGRAASAHAGAARQVAQRVERPASRRGRPSMCASSTRTTSIDTTRSRTRSTSGSIRVARTRR
jgi:isoleucyl-tRNA synthetase